MSTTARTITAAAALLILTGCGPTATDLTAPATASASPETEAGDVPRVDLLEEFYASPEGEPWAGTVTQLEKIGPAGDGGIPVYVATTVGVETPEDAVAVCQAVQSALTDGTEQVNVNSASRQGLASTTGEPETCTPDTP